MVETRPAPALPAVPFFSAAASWERDRPAVRARLERVVRSGRFVDGAVVRELEDALAERTGARHAIACGNGTDALVLLLAAAGVGPGDEVVVPCFTFVASASSVALLGARPVFVDVEPVSYALDPEAVRAAVGGRTRAIMPVHLFSQMADMDALREVAAATGVPLLEDSAEAIGMRWDGVHAGLLGRGGVLSFFPTKTLGASGDGGMVLTDDEELADACRRLARGRSSLDELQAAILLARLERLDADVERRAALAALYDELLAPLEPLVRRPRIVPRRSATNPVWYVYLVEVERKPELVAHLASAGIETEEYYPRPLHLQPAFASLGHRPGDFPTAEAACRRTLALPLYPDLAEAAVEHVCRTVADFYGSGG